MPKKARELSALDVKRLERPGRHAVGSVPGLLLCVKDSGSKSWILRTVVGTKRRNIGLGGYPEVSLAEAREQARRIKRQVKQGVDPVALRKSKRLALIRSQNGRLTFAEAAYMCHEKKASEFRNRKHKKQWISSLEAYAFPAIGRMAAEDVDLPDVLRVLEPIWTQKTETATRVRQRMEAVLSWATVSGYRKGDNPARWQGHLDAVLPKPSKLKKGKHHAALPWKEIGSFMADLRKREGIAARCLEFIILTAVRSGEARLATWDEIDLEAGTWTIPSERMKAGREHVVPLSEAVLSLLKALPVFEGSPYIFTAPRGGPLSDMTVSAVCRRMGVEAVPHGFRSTFRDWCAESTAFPGEVAEMALAHVIPNKAEAAYRRGDLLQKRRNLMEAWAEYCSRIPGKGAEVTPIRRTL